VGEFLCGVAENGRDAAGVAIGVDESGPVDPIATLPFDGEAGIGLLQVDGFGVAVPGQTGRKVVGDVEQPGITGVGGEKGSSGESVGNLRVSALGLSEEPVKLPAR